MLLSQEKQTTSAPPGWTTREVVFVVLATPPTDPAARSPVDARDAVALAGNVPEQVGGPTTRSSRVVPFPLLWNLFGTPSRAGRGSLSFRELKKWTRSLPIRTAARMPIAMSLARVQSPFVYQTIAVRAAHLDRLGLTASAIARLLGVTDKTVAKAIRWAASPRTPLLGGGRRSSRRSPRGP